MKRPSSPMSRSLSGIGDPVVMLVRVEGVYAPVPT